MEFPIFNRIRHESFEPLAWFATRSEDRVPPPARFVILIGNAGPNMFRRFAQERDPARDALDEWTRSTVDALANDLDARAVYPFDLPYYPFLTWARRGGGGHISPIGLNIHPSFGLWHAYRAALLFPVVFDLPTRTPGPSPCDSCATKPCLGACPVDAFSSARYDAVACARHIASDPTQMCDPAGCKARCACPVGAAYRYEPQQMAFHMNAFRKTSKATI